MHIIPDRLFFMTTRNSTIDLAKGMGIFFVVLGHNWLSTHEKSELTRVIFSFHMPLFFFLAGIFLRAPHGLLRFAIGRTGSLLKPYFIVLTALGILKIVWATLDGDADISGTRYFIGLLYGTGDTIAWITLWFLPHLFISLIASLIILRAVEACTDNKVWIASVALMLLGIGIGSIDAYRHPTAIAASLMGPGRFLGLPWGIDLIPITSSFIIFGYLLATPVKSMKFSLPGLFVSAVVFVALHFYFDDTIDLNERVYDSAVVSTVEAATGIYITLSIASLLQNFSSFRKPLAYLGSGTLFILIFHDFLQTLAFDALHYISPYVYLNSIVSLAWSIGMSLLLWEMAKRQRWLSKLLLPQKPKKAIVRNGLGRMPANLSLKDPQKTRRDCIF
ncbi:acyltransferase family protein [Nitrosospira multiformis]|nr:acyltransferase family protein [Nitrosospira multiformis]